MRRSMMSGVAAALVLMQMCVSPAVAQDAGAPQGAAGARDVRALEEVVVTGEKVRRSLRETASSVEVVSGDKVRERPEAENVQDVLRSVPNVLYTGSGSAPVIRGVEGQGSNSGSGAFFGGTVPRARINVDGHNLGFWETVFGTTSIWDVESIEVFRGPQTAAQGANSIAGAILVNTRDPGFVPEREVQLQVGNRKGRRASAVLSGPLSGEQLAARLAVDHASRNTYIDYVNPAYRRGDTDLDPSNSSVRLKFLFTPTAVPELESKLTLSWLRTNQPTSEAANAPHDRLQSNTLTMPSFNTRAWTGVHDISYDLTPGVTLSNQLQYTRSKTERVSVPFSNGGAYMNYRDFSEEFRVNFKQPDSALSGVVGLYLDQVDSDDLLYVRGTTAFDDEKRSLGIFSEGTWRFGDGWSLTAGLRYQNDKVKRAGATSFSRNTLDFDESYHKLLPRLSLAHDVNPVTTVGVLVSRGYNPGGVGLQFANGQFYTFQPETMWNHELFARTRVLDNRLALTANLFHAQHRDSQLVTPDYLNGVLFGNVVRNADRSRAYGLELSADYAATDRLSVQASLGLLRTRINRFSDANGQAFVGNEFAKAPGHMVGLNLIWKATDPLELSLGARHVDGYYSNDDNQLVYHVDGYTVANARASWQASKSWRFYAYVDNLFDERKPTYGYEDRTAGGAVATVLEPRSFGVGVNVKF